MAGRPGKDIRTSSAILKVPPVKNGRRGDIGAGFGIFGRNEANMAGANIVARTLGGYGHDLQG